MATARALSRINAGHITTPKLHAALQDMFDEYIRFRLPLFWRKANVAVADGTHLLYLKCGVDLANGRKLINPELERPIPYNSYNYFVQHDSELSVAWQSQRT